MIYNAAWRTLYGRVVQRLALAHPDLSRIVAELRDFANVEVYTESPSDTTVVSKPRQYSLEGWRVHYRDERAWIAAFNQANGALVQGFDAQCKTAMDGYLASIAALAPAFNTAIAAHRDAQGRVIQAPLTEAERTALANAIEAELQ